ncbi:hypothetical protein [Flavobacterium selenitireducens]|uniref:hypothetical protein n=1 Tax=Flavobacterium selenitireducens TaxID=2722704 RepID=UPI00168B7740|nr:hypothetical protein [Flavobacterium selenitireducens]MBD3581233.1 hypothetical protein [Flavobacterium selenitireducens]
MKKIILIGLILFGYACQRETREVPQIPFDKAKWDMTGENGYPYRDNMLSDLMDDQELKGLTREKLFDKLGQPTRTQDDYVYYRILEQKLGFATLHTKTLVLHIENDEVNKVLIHE